MTRKRGNNEGSIFQRKNGSWRAQVSIDDQRLSQSFKTRREAQDWVRRMSNQIDTGLTLRAAKITLAEYMAEWLDTAKLQVAQYTWHRYNQLTRDHVLPALGRIRLRDLNPRQIQHFYNSKFEEGMGARTVQKTHTVIHAALNTAVKQGLITVNPASAARPPKSTPQEKQFLREDQVEKLLKTAWETDDRRYALYYLALVTGMREGELLGLRWADVDLDNGIIHVRSNLKRLPGGGLELTKPKTKTSRRSIKLGTDSIQVLQDQQGRIKKWKAEAGRLWEEHDHVFPSSAGTPFDPSNLLRSFRILLERAGLPRIRFHDLRHTAASLMLNNGVDVLVASQRLGHAQPSITLDVYGHLMPSMQNKAAVVLESLVKQPDLVRSTVAPPLHHINEK